VCTIVCQRKSWLSQGDHLTEAGISDKVIERTVATYGTVMGMKLTPHDLCATFITLALEGGAALHQVQYAAGHARPETTERYHRRKLNHAVDDVRL
jgi:integrase